MCIMPCIHSMIHSDPLGATWAKGLGLGSTAVITAVDSLKREYRVVAITYEREGGTQKSAEAASCLCLPSPQPRTVAVQPKALY